MPTVSVIVPMHNAENYIADSLESILQTKITVEVIVVDDKSTDQSRNTVRNFNDPRIRVVDGPGTGIADSLNIGLKEASGNVLMRCDADDLYPAKRISDQLTFLDNHPDYDAVCGSFSTIDPAGKLIIAMDCGESSQDITSELRTGKTRTHLGTFAIRTSAAQRLDGFRSYFKSAEDIDYQLRLSEVAKVFYQPVQRYFYRIHNSSITHTMATNHRDFYEMMARRSQVERLAARIDFVSRGLLPPLDTPQIPSAPLTSAEHIQGLLMAKAWREFSAGNRGQAMRSNLEAISKRPTNLSAWKSFLAISLKRI